MAVQDVSQQRPSARSNEVPKRGLSIRTLIFIRHTLSYVFLLGGALFMLFPVFWMVTTALKPEWQIFSRPIIWLPQEWRSLNAGDTVRIVNLYKTQHDGEVQTVAQLGSRRYTTALATSTLPSLELAPANEISEATIKQINSLQLNVRQWNGKEVVAVGRSGDDLLVVPLESLQGLTSLPLDALNGGKRETYAQGEYTLQARTLEVDGVATSYLALGPQTQQTTVVSADIARYARLVPAESLGEARVTDVGESQLETVSIEGKPHLVLEQSLWQPALELSLVQGQALAVPTASFTNKTRETSNGAVLTVGTVANETGRVVQVLANSETVLVVPLEVAKQTVMVPATSLQNPFALSVHNVTVRFKDFTLPTVKDETINRDALPPRVVLLGKPQNMALVVPVSQLGSPFDVPGERLQRDTRVSFKWQNIADALSRRIAGAGFGTFFMNSIIITVLSILGHLLSCTVVAYAFARMRAPGKNILFTVVIATMMLPEFVTLVPVYTIFRDLGLVDTLVPLYIRSFFGNAFLIFLLRQFFSTIPRDLEDAAYIDGATRWQTFTRIMLPLVSPALATVAIFTFLWRWNDLFNAAIYLNSPKNYTVAIGLNAFKGAYTAEFSLLMAAATIVMLPTVLLFFFAQRFFIDGITLTGVKG